MIRERYADDTRGIVANNSKTNAHIEKIINIKFKEKTITITAFQE